MKTVFRSVSLILLVVFAFSSCEKNSDSSKGTAKFSIASIEESNQLKSAWAEGDLVSYHLMVSVEDNEGNPVFTGKLVPVYPFGPGYISEEMEMEARMSFPSGHSSLSFCGAVCLVLFFVGRLGREL